MIRRASLADLDALVELENIFPSDRMSRRSLHRALQSASACLWVALHEGQISGSLVLLTRRGSRKARIYSVGVHPRARGQGVARALLAVAEQQAAQAHLTAMSLEVREDNTVALELYRRMGYSVQRKLPSYYDDGAAGLYLLKRFNVDLPIGSPGDSG